MGEEIPLSARIVAVADSYDAMNSKRIYRNPLPAEVIRQEIVRNKGIQFDPVVADAFLKLLDEKCIQKVREDVRDFPVEAGTFISPLLKEHS